MNTVLLTSVAVVVVMILMSARSSFVGVLVSLLLVGAVTECQSYGKDLKLLDVDEVNVSTAKFGCNREPMTPQYGCKDYVGRVEVDFNLRILGAGYWDNNVHTEGLRGQVKTVGWHFEMGAHVTPYLDMFYEHHSRHVMEGDQPLYYDHKINDYKRGVFPVEDSYGIRFKFYTNPKASGSLFGGG